MGWEMRPRGGPYYTTSERVGGRVVRRYFGKGEVADLFAASNYYIRRDREQDRQMQREALAAASQEIARIEAVSAELDRAADQIFKAAMEQAGYHQHKRGERRKRRGHQGADEDGSDTIAGSG